MSITKEQFKKDYVRMFQNIYPFEISEGSPQQHFYALGILLRYYASVPWRQTKDRYIEEKKKQVYYFSMEFLPGRQLFSNAYHLNILDVMKEGLEELELDVEKIEEAEADPALGNGGLGRLASAFMDSLSSIDLPGNGNGIRYQYGLFRQKIIGGYQIELPENWLQNGNPWEVRNLKSAVTVRFGGEVRLKKTNDDKFYPQYENTLNVLAVPYDTPVIGYKNGVVNTLRLWTAEIPPDDEAQFLSQQDRQSVHQLSEVLYPNDSTSEGRALRVKQEYFMVSAGIQSIIEHFWRYGEPIEKFAEFVAIHINDTHPALAVPELMRILMDEEALTWEQAWTITTNVCSYTNHTIMKEAMEKWSVGMIKQLLPRIYQIIEEIDRRHVEQSRPIYGNDFTERTAIIQDGTVHMAHLAVIGSHSVNGVAELHTSILKEKVMPDFYTLSPHKFNNKTNGIVQRRWLHLANPEMKELLCEKIGERWLTDPSELALFKVFADDEDVLERIGEIKYHNKEKLARLIKKQTGIIVSPDALFDVQIKRLHEYKRQLMNALHIVDRYIRIKENPGIDMQPRVFIFGAKAAPNYSVAKYIIKLIHSIADLVNQDEEVGDRLKVVFLENYSVSLAEKIIPAAEISEQISLASKEASGTGNMKMMLNGALTMATLDGANVEIRDKVGEENIFLFGLTSPEVYEYYDNGEYNPQHIYENDERIRTVIDKLIDGTIPDISEEGPLLHTSLIQDDPYFILKDLTSYIEAQDKADERYRNKKAWNRSALLNIASAGSFSSDYTIRRYAKNIWDL